jgi:hypothetical protein
MTSIHNCRARVDHRRIVTGWEAMVLRQQRYITVARYIVDMTAGARQ